MPTPLAIIGGIAVARIGAAMTWQAGLAVDGDGCPTCYAPPDSGLPALDRLANAGHPGNWWGLVTDTGEPTGKPLLQGPLDPAPGYYISPTALGDPSLPSRVQRRYVNSNAIPYLAIPPEMRRLGLRLGDVALVSYQGRETAAIVADIGPAGKLGEGSIELARALGLNASPKHGGIGGGVRVVVWPASAAVPAWPRTLADIAEQVGKLRAQLPQLTS